MGISKKKFKAKLSKEEMEVLEEGLSKSNQPKLGKDKLDVNSMFQENVSKANLKLKREKLKADRFKRQEAATTSKTETVLVKRFVKGIATNEARGVKPNKKTKLGDDFFGGELEDVWDTPSEVKSKKFEMYKDFAKKDMVKVKQVIVPEGGLSYNPSLKDHKKSLINAVKKEEEQVEKQMKELKVVRASAFDDQKDDVSEDSDQESSSSETSSDSEAEEFPEKINEAVDRT